MEHLVFMELHAMYCITLYTVHCTLYIVHSTPYTVHCIVYNHSLSTCITMYHVNVFVSLHVFKCMCIIMYFHALPSIMIYINMYIIMYINMYINIYIIMYIIMCIIMCIIICISCVSMSYDMTTHNVMA